MADDKLEIDALLNPTLGDTRKVVKDLETALDKASKPLVDTLSNVRVGLNAKDLSKLKGQLDTMSANFGSQFKAGVDKVMDDLTPKIRSAAELKGLAATDKNVATMVKALGGFDEAATLLNRPDANRRLTKMVGAYQTLSDSAHSLANLPGIDDKTQGLLRKLYASNDPNSFRKMSQIQQRQVMDAMATLDIQNEAFRNIRSAMARAGMGNQAARMAASVGERREIAKTIRRNTGPGAIVSAARADEAAKRKRERLQESEARTRAVSLEKDRVLQRSGGIQGLRSTQDIASVRAGLNRDLNYATQAASLAATGRGGVNSKAYREAAANVDAIQQSRKALNEHTQALRDAERVRQRTDASRRQAEDAQMVARAKHLARQGQMEQSRDAELHRMRTRRQGIDERRDTEMHRMRTQGVKAAQSMLERRDTEMQRVRARAQNISERRDTELHRMRTQRTQADQALAERRDTEMQRVRTRRQGIEESRDIGAVNARVAAANARASFSEANRTIQRVGGIGQLRDQTDIAAVRSGLNARNTQLVRQRELAQEFGNSTVAIDRQLESLRNQRQLLADRVKAITAENKALQTNAQLRTRAARNTHQARNIYRQAGGDFEQLDRNQLRQVRPYLQDRFRSRTQYAEGVAQRHGADSPEFARATQSARQYAQALGELDDRARQLRPAMTDLGHIVHSFIRYALGYGALYQLLGGVVALGRGLADLDQQLHSIQAITLSTDGQMRMIDGAIKQVGLTTKFTLNEIAQGAQILAQAGSAPEIIPRQLKATADFAAATNTSLSDAADLLTSFQNVYKDLSSGQAADLLTKALNLSKLQGTDLRTIISYTAQTAEGYGIAADHLLGAVATLRNVGIRPSTVATGLRQAMLEIFSPDSKLTKALAKRYEDLGEVMTDSAIQSRFNAFTNADNPLLSAVAELRRLGFGGEASSLFSRAFDVRAYNPLSALVNNFEQFSQLTAQVNVGQSAIMASEIQMESFRATMENLGAATIVFSDSIGGGMVRSLQQAGAAATELLQELTKLDQVMKMETGKGLGSVIGMGAAGGLAGAMLGGRGNRLGGAAAGAFAGGGAASATSGSDYILPTIAGIMTIVPALMDFSAGFSGRQQELKTIGTKLQSVNKGKLGAVAGMGASLAGIFASLGSLDLPSSGTGALDRMKGAGPAMLRAVPRLLLRAIPIVGALWTAYELLSLISGSQGSQLQKASERARTRAVAADDIYRSAAGQRETDLSRADEFRLDAFGNAESAHTTAGTAAKISKQVKDLNAAVYDQLGVTSDALGDATKLINNYSSRNLDQRQQDLIQINEMFGTELDDKAVYDLSTAMRELDTSVEGYRFELMNQLNRFTDDLQTAIAKGDADGIARATQMQQVVDSMPKEMADLLYGTFEGTSAQASDLFIDFNNRMAAELDKSATSSAEVLDKRIKAVILQIDAIAITLGDSPQMRNAINQLITSITLTESAVANALNKLAEDTANEAANLSAEAEKIRARELQQGRTARMQEMGGLLGGGNFNTSNIPTPQADQMDSQVKARQQASEQAAKAAEMARDREQASLAEQTDKTTEIVNKLADANSLSEEFIKLQTASDRKLLEQLRSEEGRAALGPQLAPVQSVGGEWRPSPLTQRLMSIDMAEQQARNTKEETSAQKLREQAKADLRSDPAAMVEIARLENARRAADRRNQYGESQRLTENIHGLQYGEQQKAVGRAKIDMEAAIEADRRDATSAIERYHSELAKLESMRGQMADKLDEYQRKVAEMDLKREVVNTDQERRRIQNDFNEAVTRGDYEGAKKASDVYIEVQRRLQALAERELELKGHTPEQIQLEMRLRDDLTKTLIDQEGAQKRLTAAILAQSNFRLRDAGSGPTTGNKATDAFVSASGIGFTDAQFAEAYARDLETYAKEHQFLRQQMVVQMADLTGAEARATEREFTEAIDAISAKIGETAAHLNTLQMQYSDHLLRALNPTALLAALESAPDAMKNYGDNIRGHLVSAVDDLGQSFADVLRNTESWDDALKGVIHTLANSVFESTAKMGVNWLVGQGVGMFTSGADQSSTVPGLGGSEESGGIMGILGGILGGGAGGMTPSMNVQAGTVTVNAAAEMGAGGLASEAGELFGEMKEQSGGLFSGMMDKASGLFDGLKGGFGSLFGSLGSMLGGLFGGGGGGGGGGWLQLGIKAAGAYFGGGAGAAAGAGAGAALRDGGMPARVINGPRSAQRDNLNATATVDGKRHPINVEAGEGILSRKAMALIGGERGLNALNRGAVPGFAAGGVPQSAPSATQYPVFEGMMGAMKESASAAAGAEPNVTIANILSEDEFENFVQSRKGVKVIVNELKRNGYL